MRRHPATARDQRHPFQRDRDRLLYSSGFQRLAGVTQIVRVGEADFFHTRQQHTIKVAQIARRLAEYCQTNHASAATLHGVDPDVVEAAAIAHDMGHPPFGHVAEYELNDLVTGAGDVAGFEGNAQSFRIVTKLSVRFDEPGLNLCRATLAAILKYPWVVERTDARRNKKWSAFPSEEEDFSFAREFHPHSSQTAEAALMDWADDIAYSVHDMEDCHRSGLIPWADIFDTDQSKALIAPIAASWHNAPSDATELLTDALTRLKALFAEIFPSFRTPYDGCREQRKDLRTVTSALIKRFVLATSIVPETVGEPLNIDPLAMAMVQLLKRLTRLYIIQTPSLAAQQHGQRVIIRGLFQAIMEGGASGRIPGFTPARLRYLWDYSDGSVARFAADFVSSLTERQAVELYGRLYGSSPGSVLDPLIR